MDVVHELIFQKCLEELFDVIKTFWDAKLLLFLLLLLLLLLPQRMGLQMIMTENEAQKYLLPIYFTSPINSERKENKASRQVCRISALSSIHSY